MDLGQNFSFPTQLKKTERARMHALREKLRKTNNICPFFCCPLPFRSFQLSNTLRHILCSELFSANCVCFCYWESPNPLNFDLPYNMDRLFPSSLSPFSFHQRPYQEIPPLKSPKNLKYTRVLACCTAYLIIDP